MAQRSFKVPVALAPDGLAVVPSEALAEVDYKCPGCGDVVRRRKGPGRPHFAHGASSTCSGETALHHAAKHYVARVIRESQRGERPAPRIARLCPICARVVEQALPTEKRGDVAVEHRLTTGRIPDVTVLHDGVPQWAIEIRATHAVSDEKAADLTLPWFEVDATAVIEQPFAWTPVRDGFVAFTCSCCIEDDTRRQRLGEALAEVGFRQAACPLFVPVTTHPCSRCGAAVPLYNYLGRSRPLLSEIPPHTGVETASRNDWLILTVPGYRAMARGLVVRTACHRCRKLVTGPARS